VLPVNGKYVLRVQYTDGTSTKLLSQEITVSAAPEITLNNGKVVVKDMGYELLTMSVFYLDDGAAEDPSNWFSLKAAAANIAGSPYGAAGYKTYTGEAKIGNIRLTTAGNYALRLRYQDANGNVEVYVLTVEVTV